MYTEPSSFDVDNHPRIIIWDEKERLYRMVKLHDDTTSLTTKHNFIFLNRININILIIIEFRFIIGIIYGFYMRIIL